MFKSLLIDLTLVFLVLLCSSYDNPLSLLQLSPITPPSLPHLSPIFPPSLLHMHIKRCWDIIEGLPWWIIKTPILIAILVSSRRGQQTLLMSSHRASVQLWREIALQCLTCCLLFTPKVNFFLFICIIRILQQKINCPDIGRKESNQYS